MQGEVKSDIMRNVGRKADDCETGAISQIWIRIKDD